MTYAEKLSHPKWQQKRLKILERDEWRCVHCGDSDSSLEVHHHSYRWNADPWDYDDSNLITLCHECHSLVTKGVKELKSSLSKLGPCEFDSVVSIFSLLSKQAVIHDYDLACRAVFVVSMLAKSLSIPNEKLSSEEAASLSLAIQTIQQIATSHGHEGSIL